eukprot:TRINITY_DN9603_c1_g1_i1.p2 TRINITY_DN9603_c1_g1~~TRINITY_DN9603_c1_g1_i1.p2  ORF type:complete len:184 (-),score=15.13 TRINITY_DN9603_c1_g1_i1:567-1085(-)
MESALSNLSLKKQQNQSVYKEHLFEKIDNKTQEILQSDELYADRVASIENKWQLYGPYLQGLKERVDFDNMELQDNRRQTRQAFKRLQTMYKSLQDIPQDVQYSQFSLPPPHSLRAERAYYAHALCKIEYADYNGCWKPMKALNEIVIPSLKQSQVDHWDVKDQLRKERWGR